MVKEKKLVPRGIILTFIFSEAREHKFLFLDVQNGASDRAVLDLLAQRVAQLQVPNSQNFFARHFGPATGPKRFY